MGPSTPTRLTVTVSLSLCRYRVLNKLKVGDLATLDIIRGNAKEKTEVTLMDSQSVIPKMMNMQSIIEEMTGGMDMTDNGEEEGDD